MAIGIKINGDKLRRAISLAGYRRKEFAEKLGISPVAIHYWIKGLCSPAPDRIEKMAKILKCDQSTFIDGTFEAQQALEEHIAKEKILIKTDVRHFRSALIEDLSAMDLPAETLIKVLTRVRTFDPDNRRID